MHRTMLLTFASDYLQMYTLNVAKVQYKLRVAFGLNFFGMKVWNGIWMKILVWNGIWNGRFLVWNENGMEENCQYGIWKNHFPFRFIPYALLMVQHSSLQVLTLIDF